MLDPMDGLIRPHRPLPDDPLLPRIAADLRAHFGDRLARLVLYGSRARGDHTPDSDYDVAAFLKGEVDWSAEWDRLIPLQWMWFGDTGLSVEVQVFSEGEENRQTLFMMFLRQDGIDL